jgi:hypothetical protein
MNPQLRYFLRPAVLATALCLQLMAAPSFAEDATPKKQDAPPPGYVVPDPWGGFGFGLGISMSADLGRQSHIVEANNINGIVRIKDTQDVIVGFVLEAHYFFNQGNWNPPYFRNWNSTWGTGPFVAIEIGGSGAAPTAAGPITAYGLGWMIGFREPSWDYSDTTKPPKPRYAGNLSWNFGLGLVSIRGLGSSVTDSLPTNPSRLGIRSVTKRHLAMALWSFHPLVSDCDDDSNEQR